MTKQVALFALSWREGGICVAGKDIKAQQWIRPVTQAGPVTSGQVSGFRLMDVVEMDLGKPVPVHHQIENYDMIQKPWIKKSTLRKQAFNAYLDAPASIWDTAVNKGSDSLTPAEIAQAGIANSLMLIKLPSMMVLHEIREYDGRHKHYGVFTYNNVKYKLSITDSAFTNKYPAPGSYQVIDPILCISLAEVFAKNGKCYKLIAGVM
jgi:hypothetical protein